MIRWSRAVRRRYEHRRLPTYGGGRLYPGGAASGADTWREKAPENPLGIERMEDLRRPRADGERKNSAEGAAADGGG
jgi:hypothetical protein